MGQGGCGGPILFFLLQLTLHLPVHLFKDGLGRRREVEKQEGLSFKFLFIYLFLAVLSLRCCTQAFRCGKKGLLLLRRMDTRHAGFSICGKGLSCSMVRGIFQYQGLNWCPLHWQGDSQLLTTRKVPRRSFLMFRDPTSWPSL